MIFIKSALSDLIQDTGNLVSQVPDNRIPLLLARMEVVVSLILTEVERIDKRT